MLEPEDYNNLEKLSRDLHPRPRRTESAIDFVLILDEYDRSDTADDIQWFIERLTAHLPENCRLVINSRTLPRLPWVAMIAQGRALMLEDDQLIRENFYDIRGARQPNARSLRAWTRLCPVPRQAN